MSAVTTLNGASAVVAGLVRHGVRHVFAIPGTHNLELYRALASSSVETVAMRHEQGAGFAADGYARTSGVPGVCVTTSGPGLTNACTAIGTAHADSVPLLVIAPGPPRECIGRDLGLLHEMRDQRHHLESLVGTTFRAETVDDVGWSIDEAFCRLGSARPRPAYIEVPVDVLEARWDDNCDDPEARRPVPSDLPQAPPPPEAIDRAAAVLGGAERPVMLVGGGATHAAEQVVQLAERLGALALTTVNGKGVLPETHPLSLGACLRLAAGRALLHSADVLVVIGSELADTDFWGHPVETSARVIRIDIDPVQLDKNLEATVALCGPSASILSALLERFGERAANTEWSATAPQRRKEICAEAARDAGAYREINSALAAVLPDDTIVAGDSAQVSYLGTVHFWPVRSPRQFLYPTGYAPLGYGLPAAIGAKLAAPKRSVVVLVGDGGFCFTALELASATALGMPLPVVVVDNGGYEEIRAEMLARGITPMGVDLPTIDLGALARALGGEGRVVADTGELCSEVLAALRRSHPSLITLKA